MFGDADPVPVAKKFVFKWTDEMTFSFIRFRSENDHLFTGHRNASTQGYDEIIKIMDLEGKVTPQQCKKKWENLKKKYKDLSLPKTGSGTDEGEVTAATWIFYAAMHEAIGQRPSVRPVSFYSSGPSSVVVSQTENEDKVDTASLSAAGAASSEVSSPESSPVVTLKRPRKRKKSDESAAEGLREWCENMERRQKEEDDRDRAWLNHSQGQMDKMLNLFGKLVDHLTK
ncbi:trihelix transcription factor GT-3b-like [Melanotaenia boesemani]|uniref:trihelix transcription factor GT-3b-like n=1 Tax=Melanotaenia boesemani TaxID=1250792 RepID=UPI001C03D72A|nr:trihelix transcription factor GT-3b-like [Melanotaenia boesemani]